MLKLFFYCVISYFCCSYGEAVWRENRGNYSLITLFIFRMDFFVAEEALYERLGKEKKTPHTKKPLKRVATAASTITYVYILSSSRPLVPALPAFRMTFGWNYLQLFLSPACLSLGDTTHDFSDFMD